MPKHTIYIKTFESNPKDDSTRYNWFNECGESKWSGLYRSQTLRDEGFQSHIIPSNLDAIHARLMKYIASFNEANAAYKFRQLIRTNYIYDETPSICPRLVRPGYESREVRPNIEALFFERNDLFHDLIRKLIKKKYVCILCRIL